MYNQSCLISRIGPVIETAMIPLYHLRRCQNRNLTLAVGLILVAGCSSGPTAVEVPVFDPDGAAQKAMELYDADGDGSIGGEELDKTPGIKATLTSLDANGDGKVDEAEIVRRVAAWQKMSIGLMSLNCEVLLDGAPLEGAAVTFEPDAFLAGSIQAAEGITSPLGAVYPQIPKENRPSADDPPGIQAGIYRVRVSKLVGGKETIPARYNAETTLGQQVSKDDPAIAAKQVIFRLKSK